MRRMSTVISGMYPHPGLWFNAGCVSGTFPVDSFGLTVIAPKNDKRPESTNAADQKTCLVLGGRHPAEEMLPYWVVQILGGIAAAWILVLIARG
jgi:hypothetical protein